MGNSHKLLTAIVACIIISKAHLFFGGDNEWYAYSVGLMAQNFVICLVIYSMIGYKDVAAKWLSFMLCVFPIIEIALFLTDESYFLIAFVAGSASIAWILYASFRRYTLSSDELTSDFVYIIAKRPNSFITFLASIAGTPFGRYSYYCKGIVYYYHRDRFKKISADSYPMEESTILKTNIPATVREIENLNNAVGSKWSLFNNCLTVKLGANNG